MAVAHLALDLGLRRQRRDRVDRDDVERARADQQLGDLERLLAGVGLGDEQLVDVDADPASRSCGSIACSASMKAQMPPRRCASAITW